MEIYNDYLSTIRSAMKNDRRSFSKSHNFTGVLQGTEQKYQGIEGFLNETRKTELLPSLKDFANGLGLTPNYEQKLGSHPDFVHLKQSGKIEKHFALSMFIDIKGSTNLFKKYDPETVFIVTNMLQKAAIHTCLIFGGYVQRLHGDGLFVYFTEKNMEHGTAVENALNAASVFTYFVKNDLRELFNEQGVEAIFTRIGIDLGEAEDVVWALAGIGEISEITTCSLHTSLASKMQSSASSNGIVVGDNVKNYGDSELFTPVSKRTGRNDDRYIFRNNEDNFNYTQYDFDWEYYLKQLDFIATDLSGKLRLKTKTNKSRIADNIKPIAMTSTPYFKTDE
ncbi:MAG: hypothetical protein HYZ14_05315 [Bacteroidetes bacterium]|nr:hypothetical protein [Bacteroidota bacterium]